MYNAVKGIALAGIIVCSVFLLLLAGLVAFGWWKRGEFCFFSQNVAFRNCLEDALRKADLDGSHFGNGRNHHGPSLCVDRYIHRDGF